MSSEQRAKLLKLLAANPMVRVTSYGCGSRAQLAYRVQSPTSSISCIYDRYGKKLAGEAVPDELLLKHVREVIDQLTTFLD